MQTNDDFFDYLKRITNLLIASSADRNTLMNNVQEVLTASSKQIEKTNEIVGNLLSVTDKMTSTYKEHIGKITDANNELIRQNNELIDIIRVQQLESGKDKERYEMLVQSIVNMKECETPNFD